LQFFFRYRDESKSEKEKLSKKEEFTRYRQAIYAHASGRPIFVYKNRNIIVDMHPTKEKIMVGYQGEEKIEWFSNEEALVVWNILKQNRVAVDEKLYEYQCEDLPF
jgi:5-keto 4-deoxyuronate isomerase